MNHQSSQLIAHWPLLTDFKNRIAPSMDVTHHGVELLPDGARFNGRDSYLEMPSQPALAWGSDDFSLAVWIETDAKTDVVGDIISKYDSATRRGWHLSVVTNSGVTSTTQSNYRHLHFGIDDGGATGAWQDCGRPGNAVFVMSLATVGGALYAGTFESGAEEAGHLWRYNGGQEWVDLGAAPDGSNSIGSIACFEGNLYCCSGRYNPEGSRLGNARNTTPGGHVYRVDEDGSWHDCGVPGAEDAVPEHVATSGYETGKADNALGLTVFRGRLYATSYHRRGAYVYEGDAQWKYIGPDERLMSFTVYRDQLYSLVNGGAVYRYEQGDNWSYCGVPNGSTQTYAAATYRGELLVGTWPGCEVVRYEGEQQWTSLGRAGYEMEVMAMALYNAKVYFGTLPMANVWRLDDDGYTYIANIDNSPEVFLRRVWSMAVYQGKLFAGTLPSGRVHAYETGRMATSDCALPAGKHHVAAVRKGNLLALYLDGNKIAQSSEFAEDAFDLNTDQPLKIGAGIHQYFSGIMRGLRIYRGALQPGEIKQLARQQ